MEFEWDEAKNIANIRKHKIDFADVPRMFEAQMLIELDTRTSYGEDRWVGTGFLFRGVAVVVWTERIGNVIRIISARKANNYERKRFEEYIQH